ncbi:MAG: radical SAM protein [Phycisphaerae bacterium]|nr:radical SAM protein [Phycisphaerae bacterium]
MTAERRKPVPLTTVFGNHSRQWRNFTYVYPVISRRSRGLSIGVNLSPDRACNFDCVYCQVDRTQPVTVRKVDLGVLAAELRAIAGPWEALFDEPEFSSIPPALRQLNDIAFSGDGEPTASIVYPQAAYLAAQVRQDFGLTAAKIVTITNACFLTRPAVAEALAFLDQHNGEVWAKLDAGSEEHYARVARSRHSLVHVLENILATARVRPIVIQSLFPCLHGVPPSAEEIDAYVGRLSELTDQGGQISLVQIYTAARRPAESYVTPLPLATLEQIAEAVRTLGLRAECFA